MRNRATPAELHFGKSICLDDPGRTLANLPCLQDPFCNQALNRCLRDAARSSSFDERQFATLGAFARAIDGNVMIMAESANPRFCPRIVTAGALARSIEDAGDAVHLAAKFPITQAAKYPRILEVKFQHCTFPITGMPGISRARWRE